MPYFFKLFYWMRIVLLMLLPAVPDRCDTSKITGPSGHQTIAESCKPREAHESHPSNGKIETKELSESNAIFSPPGMVQRSKTMESFSSPLVGHREVENGLIYQHHNPLQEEEQDYSFNCEIEGSTFVPIEPRERQRNYSSSAPSKRVKTVKCQNCVLCVTVLVIAVLIGVGGGVTTGLVGYRYSMLNERKFLDLKNRIVLNSSLNVLWESQSRLIGGSFLLHNFVKVIGTNFTSPAEMFTAYNHSFFLLSTSSMQTSVDVEAHRIYVPFCDDKVIENGTCTRAMFLAYECQVLFDDSLLCHYFHNSPSGEEIIMNEVSLNSTDGSVSGIEVVGRMKMITVEKNEDLLRHIGGYFLRPSYMPSIDGSEHSYITYRRQEMFDGKLVICDTGTALSNWFRVFDRSLQKADDSYSLLFNSSGTIFAYSYGTTTQTGLPCRVKPSVLRRAMYAESCGQGGGAVLDAIVGMLLPKVVHTTKEPVSNSGGFSLVLEGDGLVISAKDFLRILTPVNESNITFIAAYATPVVSGLDKQSTIQVIICVVIVVSSIIILGGISLFSINQLQKTLELVSVLANNVTTYNLEKMQTVLDRAPRGCCLPYGLLGTNLLWEEFARILGNLRAYRPFLPQALLTNLHHQAAGEGDQYEDSSRADDTQIAHLTSLAGTENQEMKPVNTRELPMINLLDRSWPMPKLKKMKGTVLVVELRTSGWEKIETSSFVDRFLDIVLKNVRARGGVADQIEAKRVTATFNFHIPLLRHQHKACKCALDMKEAFGKTDLIIAIGITSGVNFLGTIGTDEQKARVVAGSGVDLARHLVKLHPLLDATILVTQSVAYESTVASIPVDNIEVYSQSSNKIERHTILEVVAHDANDLTVEHVFTKMLFGLISQRRVGDALHSLRQQMIKYTTPDKMPWHERRLYELCLRNRKLIEKGYKRRGLFWEPLEGEALLRKRFLLEMNKKLSITPSSSPSKIFLNGDFCEQGNASVDQSSPGYFPDDDVERAKIKIGEQSLIRRNLVKETTQGDNALISLFLAEEDSLTDGDNIAHNGANSQDSSGEVNGLLPRQIEDIKQQIFYRTDQLLGKGQFGEVYLALSESGTFLATKVLPLEENANALVREVEALIQLRHEHIVAYDTCAIQDRRFYIFIEYMAAGSMRGLISRMGHIPEKVARKYARDILFGLQFLHRMKYVHGDVKPDNVLLSSEGTCKLGDFGTVQLTRSVTDCASVLRGTPRYMAPETVKGTSSCKSDIYSFGLTLAHMLLGHGPWSAFVESDEHFLVRLAREGESMKPELPTNLTDKELELAVKKCCAYDPDNRPTVEELLAMLL